MRVPSAPSAHHPFTSVLLAASLLPAPAFAETEREEVLESRVEALEREVRQLKSSLQSLLQQQSTAEPRPPAAASTTTTAALPTLAPVPATAAAVAVTGDEKPVQRLSITPNALPGTTFRFGGFIKADYLFTRTGDGTLPDNAVGRYLYIPIQTPVGGKPSGTDADFHAKFTRFNFGVDSVTADGAKLGGFIELDFFGNATANQVNNLLASTLRHAYMTWDGWLAGQTWSNFVDPLIFPEAADIVGPTDGVVFGRQSQIRYTRGGLSVSAENTETLVSPFRGGGTVVASDRGQMPDLTARYGWKGGWGSFGIAAIAREYDSRTAQSHDTTLGGAVSVGGRWNLTPRNDLRYQLSYGEGLGRYLGLGNGPDVQVDGDGKLHPVGTVAAWAAWRHAYTAKLRSTIMVARADYDLDTDYSDAAGTISQESVRANLFYSPLPKIDVGAEVMYGRREVVSGDAGDITRLQFTTKFSF